MTSSKEDLGRHDDRDNVDAGAPATTENIVELENRVNQLRGELMDLISRLFPIIVPLEQQINSFDLHEFTDPQILVATIRNNKTLRKYEEELVLAISVHKKAKALLDAGNAAELKKLAHDPLDAEIKFLLDRRDQMTYEQLLIIKHAVRHIAQGVNDRSQVNIGALNLRVDDASDLTSLPRPLQIAYSVNLGSLLDLAKNSSH